MNDPVQLRPPERRDLPLLSRLRNDPRIQRQLMIARGHYSPRQIDAWIKRRTLDPVGVFHVIDVNGACGFVQLTGIDKSARLAWLGICLASSARGRGIAAQSLRLLEQLARKDFGCVHLRLKVLRINRRAIAFYHKMGFTVREVQRRSHDDEGVRRDVLVMEKGLP